MNNYLLGSRKRITKEINKHKGELVLDVFEIVSLEGFHEDEEDYYYVFRSLYKGVFRSSCVGGFTPLKGRLKKEEYKELERLWELNVVLC